MNAVLGAFAHDRLFAARALVKLAAVLAGVDDVARTVVARAMLEIIHDLDADVLSVPRARDDKPNGTLLS